MKLPRLFYTLLATSLVAATISACAPTAMPAKQNDAMMEKPSTDNNAATDKMSQSESMTQTQEMDAMGAMTETEIMTETMTESMTESMSDTMKSDTMRQAEPKLLLQGAFQASGSDTPGAGEAIVIEENGQHILKLSNFTSTPGPDLHVFLIENAQAKNADEFGNAIDLGALQSPNGDQQYTLPADADLSAVHAVVVHCVTYNHLFLTAGF